MDFQSQTSQFACQCHFTAVLAVLIQLVSSCRFSTWGCMGGPQSGGLSRRVVQGAQFSCLRYIRQLWTRSLWGLQVVPLPPASTPSTRAAPVWTDHQFAPLQEQRTVWPQRNEKRYIGTLTLTLALITDGYPVMLKGIDPGEPARSNFCVTDCEPSQVCERH